MPARRVTALAALAALAACDCAPSPRARAAETAHLARPDAASAHLADDSDVAIARPRPDLPRAAGVQCSIAFDDADVILARVGPTVITACDLAIARARATREGRPPAAPRVLLTELVADAMLADEARARGLADEPGVARRVRETLASGLVRAEALAAAPDAVPSDDEVRRYYDAHRDEFTTGERAHLREVVLASEVRARETLRDAAAQPFDALVRERTVTPEGRRDEGDLGLVPRGGSDRVPREIAEAGFAITEPQGIAPEPVRVASTVMEGRGRRRRSRAVVQWHIVQMLSRLPPELTPFEHAASRIRWRIARQRYDTARELARVRLLESTRREQPVAVEPTALRRVQIRPAPRPARASARRRGR